MDEKPDKQGILDRIAKLGGRAEEGSDADRDPTRRGMDRDSSGRNGKRRRGREFTRLLTSSEFMERWQPPDYTLDGLLMKGSVYTLTGNTNHGKTTLALHMAHAVATGGGLAGRLSQQGAVAFFAGENPDNVRIQWRSLCSDLGIDPTSLPIHWYEGTFSFEQARQQVIDALRRVPDLRLWLVDSFQAYFEGEDDSHNMQMLDAAKGFRILSNSHPNRPTGVILCHPIKNASRDQLLPRGGSSVTNELDGNLTIWRDGDIATLHWLAKIRGIPFDPIQFEHVLVQPEGMVDALCQQMSGPVLRTIIPERAKEIIKETKSRKLRILAFIGANPSAIHQDIANHLNVSRATAQRDVKALTDAKWIKKYAGKLVLTNEGNEVLDDAI